MNVRTVWIVHRQCTNPVGYCNIRGEAKFLDMAPLALLSIVNMIQEMAGSLGEEFYPVGIYGVTDNENVGVLTAYDDKNMLFMLIGGKKGKTLKNFPSYSNENLRGPLQQILNTLGFLIPVDCKGLHFENKDFSYVIDYAVGALKDLDQEGFTKVFLEREVAFKLDKEAPISTLSQPKNRKNNAIKLESNTKDAIQTVLGEMGARVGDLHAFFDGISVQLREFLQVPPKAIIMVFGQGNLENKGKKSLNAHFDRYSQFVTLTSLQKKSENVTIAFLIPVHKKEKGGESINKLLRPLLEDY
ncbi:MAG: hypothetical protein ACE5OZ_09210 [Candidatus Heimdallarchaeota archaeon]